MTTWTPLHPETQASPTQPLQVARSLQAHAMHIGTLHPQGADPGAETRARTLAHPDEDPFVDTAGLAMEPSLEPASSGVPTTLGPAPPPPRPPPQREFPTAAIQHAREHHNDDDAMAFWQLAQADAAALAAALPPPHASDATPSERLPARLSDDHSANAVLPGVKLHELSDDLTAVCEQQSHLEPSHLHAHSSVDTLQQPVWPFPQDAPSASQTAEPTPPTQRRAVADRTSIQKAEQAEPQPFTRSSPAGVRQQSMSPHEINELRTLRARPRDALSAADHRRLRVLLRLCRAATAGPTLASTMVQASPAGSPPSRSCTRAGTAGEALERTGHPHAPPEQAVAHIRPEASIGITTSSSIGMPSLSLCGQSIEIDCDVDTGAESKPTRKASIVSPTTIISSHNADDHNASNSSYLQPHFPQADPAQPRRNPFFNPAGTARQRAAHGSPAQGAALQAGVEQPMGLAKQSNTLGDNPAQAKHLAEVRLNHAEPFPSHSQPMNAACYPPSSSRAPPREPKHGSSAARAGPRSGASNPATLCAGAVPAAASPTASAPTAAPQASATAATAEPTPTATDRKHARIIRNREVALRARQAAKAKLATLQSRNTDLKKQESDLLEQNLTLRERIRALQSGEIDGSTNRTGDPFEFEQVPQNTQTQYFDNIARQ